MSYEPYLSDVLILFRDQLEELLCISNSTIHRPAKRVGEGI